MFIIGCQNKFKMRLFPFLANMFVKKLKNNNNRTPKDDASL